MKQVSSDAPLSVVVASHNGALYIEEQLRSIANQVPPPFEIIVSDDASEDDTVAVVQRFAATSPVPVQLVVNDPIRGCADNFLFAALLSAQPYVAYSDQDDVWLPGKVASAMAGLSLPGAMAWTHRSTVVDAELRPMRGRRLHTGLGERASRRNPLMPIPACMLVFRRNLLTWFPPTDRCLSVYGGVLSEHDEWVMFAAHALGSISWDSQPRMLYRRHSTVLSQFLPGGVVSAAEVLMGVDKHRVDVAAEAARERMDYLRRRSQEPECAGVRDSLLREAIRYEAMLPRLRRRSLQRSQPFDWRRARSVMSNGLRGDYGRVRHGGLGWWSALQDGFALFAGVLGERRRTG